MIKKLLLLLALPNNFRYPASRQLVTQKIMQPIPNITRFSNVIRILGQNPGAMTLQGTNSYLIGNSQRRLLVDTTEPDKEGYVELLENVLKEENATIGDLVITHWHYDHIGALKDLRAKKLVDNDCNVWKFPRTEMNEDFDELKLKKLEDGHEFKIDECTTLKVYYTPGHTTDHIILFDDHKKTVFSGDCILGEGTAVFEDLYDYMNSLEKILQLKPDKIYPAHGNIITEAVSKIQYYIAHRQERERQILKVLIDSAPLTVMGIVEIVYRETPENLWKAAGINVHHHLTKLKKEGKVKDFKGNNDEEYWEMSIQSNKL